MADDEKKSYIGDSALPHSDWFELGMHIIIGAVIGVLIAGAMAGVGVAVELTTPAISSLESATLTWQLGLWTIIGMAISHTVFGYP